MTTLLVKFNKTTISPESISQGNYAIYTLPYYVPLLLRETKLFLTPPRGENRYHSTV